MPPGARSDWGPCRSRNCGAISAHSDGIGHGTRFAIRLPLREADLQAADNAACGLLAGQDGNFPGASGISPVGMVIIAPRFRSR